MATKIFVNLPVKDLEKTKVFFGALGFSFNPKFTDEKGACLVISDTINCMFMSEEQFKGFAKTEVADATKSKEMILAISVESREKVDEMFNKAIAAGATEARPAQEYGWMYGRSFNDVNGHLWGVFYMDENAMPKAQ